MTYAPPDVVPPPLPAEQLGKLLTANLAKKNAEDQDRGRHQQGRVQDAEPRRVHRPGHGPARARLEPVRGARARRTRRWSPTRPATHHRGPQGPQAAGLGGPAPARRRGQRQSTPTSLAVGPFGTILIGELAHEEAGEARVLVYSQSGRPLGYIGDGGNWGNVPGGFTTITGVAYAERQRLRLPAVRRRPGEPTPGLVTKVSLFSGKTDAAGRAVPGRHRRRLVRQRVRVGVEHRHRRGGVRRTRLLGPGLATPLLIARWAWRTVRSRPPGGRAAPRSASRGPRRSAAGRVSGRGGSPAPGTVHGGRRSRSSIR